MDRYMIMEKNPLMAKKLWDADEQGKKSEKEGGGVCITVLFCGQKKKKN